uniref:Protein kinase domain-containing protein n=1 Tax=Anisakis simplex TaxID=6269 RepID=A0A0M3JH58_ANISI
LRRISGAFGEVKLVVDSRNLNIAVAMKCIDLANHPDVIDAVRKEALLQRMLRGHRNIIQYIGMRVESDDEFQIFLEYADGGELFDQIGSFIIYRLQCFCTNCMDELRW